MTDFSSSLRYAWFGAPSSASNAYTTYISSTLQPVFNGLTKNFYLALSFPFETLNNFDYYTFSFVFSGSAVTYLDENHTFLTDDVYYLGNPTYIRDRTTPYDLHLDPTYSGIQPFRMGLIEGFDKYTEFYNNSQIFKFTILADRFLQYQDTGYREADVGILFKLDEDYIKNNSDVVVLISLKGHYELTDSTTDLEILKQISLSTETIVQQISSSTEYIAEGISYVIEPLNDIADLIYTDAGFENNIDSSVSDFRSQNSRLNAFTTSILQSGVTINGVTYVISNPTSNLFEGVLAAYGSDLSNFNLTAPVSASIFRHVIDSWVSLFGILIFMSLIIGVLGALIGRSTG